MAKDYSRPTFKIFVGGSDVTAQIRPDLHTITVTENLESADMFTISLENMHAKYSDSDLFEVGKGVKIQMGYMDALAELIDGEVSALEPIYPTRGADMLIVRGYDRLHRLRRGRKQRSFVKQKYSDVANKIAGELGLTPKIDPTEKVHDYIFQTNQTNIDFLKSLAKKINYELVVEKKELHFRKPLTDKSKKFTLEWYKSLKSFYPRMSTIAQVSEVIVRGWNPRKKKEIIGKAKKTDVKDKLKGAKTGPEVVDMPPRLSNKNVVHPCSCTSQPTTCLHLSPRSSTHCCTIAMASSEL